jgi:hypothetical protein
MQAGRCEKCYMSGSGIGNGISVIDNGYSVFRGFFQVYR